MRSRTLAIRQISEIVSSEILLRTCRKLAFWRNKDAEVESELCRSEDFLDFSTLETLTRKAGVPTNRLARLVVKELVDNALDAGARAPTKRWQIYSRSVGRRLRRRGFGVRPAALWGTACGWSRAPC
jgi:hypothetical protein